MREIKFRGKCIETKKWIYGDLMWGCFIHPLEGKSRAIGNYLDVPAVQVFVSSVGQYIGLEDKNRKEIYERDIGIWDRAEDIFLNNFPVEFKNGGFGLQTLKRGFTEFSTSIELAGNIMKVMSEYEIIGNIDDNPELLNG